MLCRTTAQAALARVVPSRFCAKGGPANRIGKIFVEYLRDGHGAITVAKLRVAEVDRTVAPMAQRHIAHIAR